MTDSVSIVGIEVFAHHGLLEHERESGQLFSIDVELELDLAAAGKSDDLGDTVDYGSLAERVHRLVAGERWNLIERVGQRVADLVLEDPRVAGVQVTVHKPEAPIAVPFSDVTVSVNRRR